MELFQIKDYSLIISPEAYSLTVFKNIWDSDKSKDKSIANKELAFIYFFADGRSDFINEIDLVERTEKVKTSLSLSKDWKPSKLVLEAIDFYIEREKTVETELLEACLIAAHKVGEFLKSIDLNAMDEKGKLIHNVKQINETLKQAPSTIKALIEARREIKKDKETKSGARGSIEKGMMEDGE